MTLYWSSAAMTVFYFFKILDIHLFQMIFLHSHAFIFMKPILLNVSSECSIFKTVSRWWDFAENVIACFKFLNENSYWSYPPIILIRFKNSLLNLFWKDGYKSYLLFWISDKNMKKIFTYTDLSLHCLHFFIFLFLAKRFNYTFSLYALKASQTAWDYWFTFKLSQPKFAT